MTGMFDLDEIFKSKFKYAFTTSLDYTQHPSIHHVSLSDKSLGVHKITSQGTHELVKPPKPIEEIHDNLNPPKEAWEAFYPKGSINPSSETPGGFGFYLTGPPQFAEALEGGAKEVILGYRMMLQPGWEWAKGGKLPGVFGGVGNLAYSCSGGRQDKRCQCFDLRVMWRPQGAGELYTYLPLTETNSSVQLAVPPLSRANSDFGFSVGRGSFHLAVGHWVSISFRVKLNTHGEHNGEIQLWVDGKSVINMSGVSICQAEGGKIKGMHFQTFFGGHDPDWASPKDQCAWFADVSGAILE